MANKDRRRRQMALLERTGRSIRRMMAARLGGRGHDASQELLWEMRGTTRLAREPVTVVAAVWPTPNPSPGLVHRVCGLVTVFWQAIILAGWAFRVITVPAPTRPTAAADMRQTGDRGQNVIYGVLGTEECAESWGLLIVASRTIMVHFRWQCFRLVVSPKVDVRRTVQLRRPRRAAP